MSERLVDDIAANWDEVASELVLYSDRGDRPNDEGGLWIINGQHRTAAAQKRGMKKIWARVVDLTDVEDPGAIEADLRLKTNKRIGDMPAQRFKAQLRAGDPESIHIRDILAGFDSQINEVADGTQGINSVSAVEKLYRVDDGKLLTESLVSAEPGVRSGGWGGVQRQPAQRHRLVHRKALDRGGHKPGDREVADGRSGRAL